MSCGKLVGVSEATIYNSEQGRAELRSIRGNPKTEAFRRLAEENPDRD